MLLALLGYMEIIPSADSRSTTPATRFGLTADPRESGWYKGSGLGCPQTCLEFHVYLYGLPFAIGLQTRGQAPGAATLSGEPYFMGLDTHTVFKGLDTHMHSNLADRQSTTTRGRNPKCGSPTSTDRQSTTTSGRAPSAATLSGAWDWIPMRCCHSRCDSWK